MDKRPTICRSGGAVFISLLALVVFPSLVAASKTPFVTASLGAPNRGRLINGIPFPAGLGGYKLRSPRHSYTSPEVIGGILAAIFTVEEKYPGTCDLQLGDFSLPRGGRFWPHKSHQNGRDADIGMYGRGNIELPGLIRMSSGNIDVAKTWVLVESLLRSKNIEYIFLDMRLQRLLCRYALKHGVSAKFLKRNFQWASGCKYTAVVRHDGKHSTHLHVRFQTPWSKLAGRRWGKLSKEDLMIISACQEGYLPHKYIYIAERSTTLADVSKQLGISAPLLKKWNKFKNNRISAGSSLRVYKIGYQPLATITLARLLHPEIFPSPEHRIMWPLFYGDFTTDRTLRQKFTACAVSYPENKLLQVRTRKKALFHWIKGGDTLSSIAIKYHVSVYDLCKWNGINRHQILPIGKRLRIYSTYGTFPSQITGSHASPIWGQTRSGTSRVYIIRRGDNLWSISRKLGVPLSVLYKLNNLTKRSVLKPGQRIVWAKGSHGNRKMEKKSSDSGFKKLTSQNKTYRSKFYVVRCGDTLWKIAKKNGVSVRQLCLWNNIESKSILSIGQKIKIYQAESIHKRSNSSPGA